MNYPDGPSFCVLALALDLQRNPRAIWSASVPEAAWGRARACMAGAWAALTITDPRGRPTARLVFADRPIAPVGQHHTQRIEAEEAMAHVLGMLRPFLADIATASRDWCRAEGEDP